MSLNAVLWLAGSVLLLSPWPAFAAGTNPSLSGLPIAITGSTEGTYPRANFLSDGSILAAYTVHNPDNQTVLTLSRSTDRGTTWSETGTADSGSTYTQDIDNPYPLQLPNGRVLLAFRNHDGVGTTSKDYTYFRITVVSSDDNGATWNYSSTPDGYAGTNGNGIWEPFLRNAQDGSLQLYYSRENNASDQDSIQRTSTDSGATWSDPIIISGGELSAARDGMLGVASIDGGSNLIAVFETSQYGQFTINSITSSDDGKTWGNRQRVYTPTGTGKNAGAPQVANVGGTLVASFMTDEDNEAKGIWVDKPAAKLVTSGDGGKTWGNKITFSPADSYWPGLLTLNESKVLGLVQHGDSSIIQEIALN